MNKINSCAVKGCFRVIYNSHVDDRGKFTRVFDNKDMPFKLEQASFVTNNLRGTVRGMHLQNYPHGEDKIVACLSGAMRFFVVDLRGESETFLKKEVFDMSFNGDTVEAVFVPKYCATGYQTLVEDTRVLYMMDSEYKEDLQTGFNILDPNMRIPVDTKIGVVMSDRDRGLDNLPVKPL